eukprot:155522_1
MSTLSRRAKIIIGASACVSLGFISWLVWEKFKQPKIAPTDPVDVSQIQSSSCKANNCKPNDGQLLHKKPKPLPARSTYISQPGLSDLLRSGSEHVLIDVRDEKMDHSGGHIAGSINISDKVLYESIPDIIRKYAQSPILIMYCMYGYRRSVKCMEIYVKALSEVIDNYDKDTKTSHYLMYSVAAQNDDGQSEWMDESDAQQKVQIEACDDDTIEHLRKQKLYVLTGGFFKFINVVNNRELVEGFDQSQFEELELCGVYDKKMYYHKNEYFAKRKFTVFAKRKS